MKFMIFVPPGGYFAERWSKGPFMPPLGIIYIGTMLKQNGVDVELVPAELLNLSWKEIARKIETEKPDIIGVTSTTENRFQAFKLLQIAKQARPEAWTVFGGPHASMAARDTLEYLPFIDIVVRNEGEITSLELVQALESSEPYSNLKKVQGISFRDIDGTIIENPKRPYIRPLDLIPIPDRELIQFRKYNFSIEVPGKERVPALNMMTSRGCPFNCNFCATPVNWGRAVRMHSVDRVIQEIELGMKNYGIKAVWFYDDTFDANPKRLEQLCDIFIERKYNLNWYAEVRVDILTKPLLEKMVKSGLYYLSFGVEAGSERVRKEIIRKNVDLTQVRNAIKWANELGITPNPFFIFSHPTETWEEAQETIKLIEEFSPYADISVSILHVYPGTDLEKTAIELGVIPEDYTWTRKRDPRIITLPVAQGDVPLFKHLLTWSQISELIFRWNLAQKKVSVWRKAIQAIKNIRSWKDIPRYAVMFYVYLKLKVKKALGWM